MGVCAQQLLSAHVQHLHRLPPRESGRQGQLHPLLQTVQVLVFFAQQALEQSSAAAHLQADRVKADEGLRASEQPPMQHVLLEQARGELQVMQLAMVEPARAADARGRLQYLHAQLER